MALSAAEKAKRAAKAAENANAKNAGAKGSANKSSPASEQATTAAAAAPAPAPKAGKDEPLYGVKEFKAPAVAGVKVPDRTVVVVCKMPRGLYLQLYTFIEQDQQVMGGGVQKKRVPMRHGDPVRLKGSIVPFGKVPNYPIVGGFAITTGVDAAFWSEYYRQNENLEMIKQGLLAAFNNEADATAYCREYESLRTGFEPIAQRGDKRIGAENNPNLSEIEIDTDAAPARG